MIFNWSLIKTDLYIWQKIQELRQELLQLKVIDKQALNGKIGFLSRWTRGSQLELELIQACHCKKEISKKLNLKKTREKRRRLLSIKISFLLTPTGCPKKSVPCFQSFCKIYDPSGIPSIIYQSLYLIILCHKINILTFIWCRLGN